MLFRELQLTFCVSLFRCTQLTHLNHNLESRYAGNNAPNDESLKPQTLLRRAKHDPNSAPKGRLPVRRQIFTHSSNLHPNIILPYPYFHHSFFTGSTKTHLTNLTTTVMLSPFRNEMGRARESACSCGTYGWVGCKNASDGNIVAWYT